MGSLTRHILLICCMLLFASISLLAREAQLITRFTSNTLAVQAQADEEIRSMGMAALPLLGDLLQDQAYTESVRLRTVAAIKRIQGADEQVALVLRTGLQDPQASVRRASAQALGEMGAIARAVLPELLQGLFDSDVTVSFAALNAVRAIQPEIPLGSRDAVLVSLLRSDDLVARKAAISATVSRVENELLYALEANAGQALQVIVNYVEALMKIWDADGGQVAGAVADALARIVEQANKPWVPEAITLGVNQKMEDYVSLFLASLQDSTLDAQKGAMIVLSYLDEAAMHEDALQAFSEALTSDQGVVREMAVQRLSRFPHLNDQAIAALITALQDDNHRVRALAAAGLQQVESADEQLVTAMTTSLGDHHVEVRQAAAKAIGALNMTAQTAIGGLLRLLTDEGEDLLVRRAAFASLATLVDSGSAAGQVLASMPERISAPYIPGLLEARGTALYYNGKPYYEISFNKFELFWSLFYEAWAGRELAPGNPAYDFQDQALRDLADNGFRTIRFFATMHINEFSLDDYWYDLTKRQEVFYKAMDTALDLADKHGIKVVYVLGAASFHDAWRQGGRTVYGEEKLIDLIADPESKSRQRLYEYIDEIIARYKDRDTILMWDITNELTNLANIPPREGETRMPTLRELRAFYDDVAMRIKSIDRLRLVTNGGSRLRPSAWNAERGTGMWAVDTYEEHVKAYQLLFADSAVDVIDIHFYPFQTGLVIGGDDGNPLGIFPADYKQIGDLIGKPIYLGEFGHLPEEEFWHRPLREIENAQELIDNVQYALERVVASGIHLSHYWPYSIYRHNQKGRWDIDPERTPELLELIIAANRRLQERHNSPSEN